MKHVKLFEQYLRENDSEFEAYNEFGLEDPDNITKAQKALSLAKIEFDLTSGGGITYFIFNNAETLQKAVEAVEKVIDKKKEQEWE